MAPSFHVKIVTILIAWKRGNAFVDSYTLAAFIHERADGNDHTVCGERLYDYDRRDRGCAEFQRFL